MLLLGRINEICRVICLQKCVEDKVINLDKKIDYTKADSSMKKLFSRAVAVLLASTIVFTSTGLSTFAANFDPKTANVVIYSSDETNDSITSDNTTTDSNPTTLDTDSSLESDTPNSNEADMQDTTDNTEVSTDSPSKDSKLPTSDSDSSNENTLDNSSTSDSKSEVTDNEDVTI